jgi:hypothetical protein
MTAYGSASGADLRFAYEAALEAARELWDLAGESDQASTSVRSAAADACVDFLGPMRDRFDEHTDTSCSRLREIGGDLRDLARRIAADWAAARGQQDRINFARWVEHEEANENLWDKTKEFFGGDRDYGSPPDDPPTPAPPRFGATRAPMYPEFGP